MCARSLNDTIFVFQYRRQQFVFVAKIYQSKEFVLNKKYI